MGNMEDGDYAFRGLYLVNTEEVSRLEDCGSTIVSGFQYGVFGIIEEVVWDFIIGRVKDENGDGEYESDLFRYHNSILDFTSVISGYTRESISYWIVQTDLD